MAAEVAKGFFDKDTIKGLAGAVLSFGAVIYMNSGNKFSEVTEKIPFLSKTKSLTIDLTAQARKGELSRAHDVDQKIKILIAQLLGGNGFAFVVGEPGVGKSVLIEELACRIVEGGIRRLKKARILSLDMKAAFPSGLTAMIQDVANGGISKAIETIVVHLGKISIKGQKNILYIDEIQDFLDGNGEAFNNLKVELAKNNTHIIGASMNPEKVQKWIDSHFGMKRRSRTITLKPREASETLGILEKSKKSYLKAILVEDFTISKESSVERFDVDSSAMIACVYFAEQINPEVPDPSRGTSEFKQFLGLMTDSRFDENQASTIMLSENDFLDYIRDTQDNHSTLIARWEKHKKESQKTPPTSSEIGTVVQAAVKQESLFSTISYTLGKSSKLIADEAEALSQEIIHNPKVALRIFSCKITSFVSSIIEYSTAFLPGTNLSIRRTSLLNLRTLYDSSRNGKSKIAEEVRENLKVSSEDKRNILFIEDGQLLFPHLDEFKKTKTPTKDVGSPFKAAPLMANMGQMMNSMQRTMGVNTPSPLSSSEPLPPEVTIHPIDQIFLEAINKKDLEVVIIDTSDKAQHLIASPSKTRTVKTHNKRKLEPTSEEIFEWLSCLVFGTGKTKESDKIVRTVENLVDTFLWKPQHAVQPDELATSREDLCYTLLMKWKMAQSPTEASLLSENVVWGSIVQSFDSWNIKADEVIKHLEHSNKTTQTTNKAKEQHPLSWLIENRIPSEYLYSKIPEILDNRLGRFQAETNVQVPLWIGEDSPTLKLYRQAQVARWLQRFGKTVHFFDPNVKAPEGSIIIFDLEKTDPDGDQIDTVMKAGHKVVIFGLVKDLPVSQNTGAGLMDIAKSLLGTESPTPALTAEASLLAKRWPQSITYASKKLSAEDITETNTNDILRVQGEIDQLQKEGLTEKERASFLQFQIDMAYQAPSRIPNKIVADLVHVYEHLWLSKSRTPDRMATDIKSDIPALKTTSVKAYNEFELEHVIKYFSVNRQSELEMPRDEIAYAITPSLTPISYRFKRFWLDNFLRLKNFIFQNISWAISFILSPFSSLFSFLKSPLMRFLPGGGSK
ncbi:MAG: AAA family ATPase [Verrucomicrobia bacterium]|nr:AAA family ATPase [Verrucomicrobiota bacterium]